MGTHAIAASGLTGLALLALPAAQAPGPAQVAPAPSRWTQPATLPAAKAWRPRMSAYVYTCVLEAFAGAPDLLAAELAAADVVRVRVTAKPQGYAGDPAAVASAKAVNRALHARGIEVLALFLQDASVLGDPDKARARTHALLDFQEGVFGGIQPAERFDGLDLDVEPHQHPAWGSDWTVNDALVLDLLEVVAAVRGAVVRRLGTGADALPISVAVPHWLHDRVLSGDLTVGTPTDFLQAGARVVSLFDYDDDLADLVARAAPEVADVQVPRSLEIVLKTVDDGLDDQTFFEEGCDALHTTAAALIQALAPLSAVDGLVLDVGVYEADSLRALCLASPPACGP